MIESFTFTSLPSDLLRAVGAAERAHMDPARRVYTNRDLDMSEIKMVGFDMDYTLAIYKKAPMEQLQYDLTVRRLIESMGYPEDIASLHYVPTRIVRGLTVDKRTGILFKMDTHGSMTRCYRGHRRLAPSEYEPLYRNAIIRMSSDDFASLDTLFAMPEACLYANLVEYFEKSLEEGRSTHPISLPAHHETANLGRIDTWKLFSDVRKAIDDIHRDGTLKSVIMADIETYIEVDDGLALTLHKLRSAGKRLFLLTNSYWQYTDALMSYLLDHRLQEYPSWRGYFDIVVVGGRKPGFFAAREPFLEVDTESEPAGVKGEVTGRKLERNRVYQGGNMEVFEQLVGCRGPEILYVGDHIFGDILRSKKDSRWRTCLVVEELEQEVAVVLENKELIHNLSLLDEARHKIDDDIGHQRALLAQLEYCLSEASERRIDDTTLHRLEDAVKHLKREIDQAKRVLKSLDRKATELQDDLENRFNPIWGRILKEQNELSRFGAQVSLYACTYTSRVSNFLHYSPMHYFRAPRELMSHDYALADSRGLSNVRRTEESTP